MRRAPAFGLWQHVWLAIVPIAALGVIQLLQNIDLITAKHQFSTRHATSYAVAAVAAKVLIWVAMGASFYLVPETSRRRAEGEDTRGVLVRALGIVAVCAVPCMLIYAFGAHPLLSIVFGKAKAIDSSCLLPLGAAFTVLACTYLAVQYMLALKRAWFLVVIGLVAVVEPVLLLQAPRHPAPFATVVLGVQAVGAVLAYVMALHAGGRAATTAAAARRTLRRGRARRSDRGRAGHLKRAAPRSEEAELLLLGCGGLRLRHTLGPVAGRRWSGDGAGVLRVLHRGPGQVVLRHLGDGLGLVGWSLGEQIGDLREVRPEHLEIRRRVEGGRRVVERQQAHGARSDRPLLDDTMQARDPRRVAAQELCREVAERADDRGLDQRPAAGRGTPGRWRSRAAAGRDCRAGGT